MSNYSYKGDRFIIHNYQNVKTFSSFLPAIAGVNGKPLWAFYANVGQVMAGFGVDSKDTPITPFDSANLAYMNISTRSFRTFVRVNNKIYQPFFNACEKQTLEIANSDIKIIANSDIFDYKVNYTSVPSRNYAGLLREVTITNTSNEIQEFEILDGLPIYFPHGLSNFCYKELVSLMAAYCEVENLHNNIPFVKFKTSTSDNSKVEEAKSGNAFFSIDEDNNYLNAIVDLKMVFGDNKALLYPQGFANKTYEEFLSLSQQSENKLPCAFTLVKKTLKPGESYSFITLYGTFESFDLLKSAVKEVDFNILKNIKNENKELLENILKPSVIKTNDGLFDKYITQSFLDNGLRGGFPIELTKNGEVYYIYSRKHGDMERDYNNFIIPSKYYSSGLGNFRDVNQNRRSDLYYFPFVKDYNVKLFFNLIQIDGQNPLTVKPLKFVKKADSTKDFDEDINKLLLSSFEPSELYTLLKEKNVGNLDDEFTNVLQECEQIIEASFSEGYWVDHWTYNVDLLENFVSVYPDLISSLLLDNTYKYFYSTIYVEPRSEKYCLVEDNKVRQYGAIDEHKAQEKAKKLDISLNKTHWLKNKDNQEVKTTLINKIFSLIVIKFSTLDYQQMGIEMECEKPGWNDAMNGLPGLTASALSESIELLRLIRFSLNNFDKADAKTFKTFNEQYDFYYSLEKCIDSLLNNQISSFEYWDKATTLREEFRKKVEFNVQGEEKEIKIDDVLKTFKKMELILSKGIKYAKEVGHGIIPSYVINEISKYKVNDKINFLGYKTVTAEGFTLKTIPPFLEASARLLKLGKDFFKKEDYELIKNSDLYDHKLKFYKTCADIDDAPFEIGRVHAFTKGWLERECNFLHMTYKYILGLLKAGYYEEFYEEIHNNFPIYMDVNVYGRNPIENSSFIVPTCNPDSSLHGQGFFARLTGANAEILNMITIMFLGDNLFIINDNNELEFKVEPKLHASLFDENKEARFTLFGDVNLIYHNEKLINAYECQNISYRIGSDVYKHITGQLAKDIRDCKIKEIHIYIEE